MRPLSSRAAVAVALGVAVVLGAGGGTAAADWAIATPQISATYSTAVLAPVTELSAASRCRLLKPAVDLGWTASSSTLVTGYLALRSTDGTSYSVVGTLSDRTTTKYSDSTVDLSSKYTYLVRSVRNDWYVDSAPVTVTTPTLCL